MAVSVVNPSVSYTRCGGGGRAGGASCVGARWVCSCFRGAAKGNTSTSRKTQEPIASSSGEDVLCINIKIVLHLRNERRRAIKRGILQLAIFKKRAIILPEETNLGT